MPRYQKLLRLGAGNYGCAWLVEHKKDKDKKNVLKEVNLQTLSEKEIQQSLTEVSILADCKHDHVIGYIEAFVDKPSMVLSIVMDYASGGDLDKTISQRSGLYFQNETVLRWFAQLASALCYIHQKGILHRDIKPQNIFLSSRQDLLLGDFGVSRVLSGDSVAMTFVGTPYYLSPEICLQKPYDAKSDMWSSGCVLYQLCSLRLPFTGDTLPVLASLIARGEFEPLPRHCPPALCDLVCSLLLCDPARRLSASAVLHAKVLQKYTPLSVKQTTPAAHKRFLSPRADGSGEPKKARSDKQGDGNINIIRDNPRKELERRVRVNSETYTVTQGSGVARRSFASPELSAMLERQRSNRSQSEDRCIGERRLEKETKKAPRLNILNNRGAQKANEHVGYSANIDKTSIFLGEIYNLITTGSPSDVRGHLEGHIVRSLGHELATSVMSATRGGDVSNLQQLCNHDNQLVTWVMWHQSLQ